MDKKIGMGGNPLEHYKQRLDLAHDLKPRERAWLVAEIKRFNVYLDVELTEEYARWCKHVALAREVT